MTITPEQAWEYLKELAGFLRRFELAPHARASAAAIDWAIARIAELEARDERASQLADSGVK